MINKKKSQAKCIMFKRFVEAFLLQRVFTGVKSRFSSTEISVE